MEGRAKHSVPLATKIDVDVGADVSEYVDADGDEVPAARTVDLS